MKDSGGYPSASQFNEDLYRQLLQLPDQTSMTLSWFQDNLWSEASKFRIPKEELICGMQANIFTIVLLNPDSSEARRFVVKRTKPSELPEKATMEMWKSFIASVKNEMDFYEELKQYEPLHQLFPRCYFKAERPLLTSSSDNIRNEAFFLMIMEDLSRNFYQTGEFREEQAKLVLENLAKFHAAFWQIKLNVRGSFWPLDRRPAKEIEESSATWRRILDNFPELENLVPDMEKLPLQLAEKAHELDKFVAENAVTRIHGDCKAWNLFIGKHRDNPSVIFIDMAWSGDGHPLQDVAYFLTTSLASEDLSKMDSLVQFYTEKLRQQLNKTALPKDFANLYDIFWLDYVRVIITGLWKKLSYDQMEKYSKLVGPSLITKSLDHVKFIIRRLHQKLVIENVLKQIQ